MTALHHHLQSKVKLPPGPFLKALLDILEDDSEASLATKMADKLVDPGHRLDEACRTFKDE